MSKLKALVKIKKLMASKKIAPNEIYETFDKKSDEMSAEELQEVVSWLENK